MSPSRRGTMKNFACGVVMEGPGTHTSGPAASPLTRTGCGSRGALSTTATVAVRSPGYRGENCTVMLQLDPGATGSTPQPDDARKSDGSAPAVCTPETSSGPEPSLVTVNDKALPVVSTSW